MAYVPQTYSVGEILAASKLNQMDTNIDEVRVWHLGTSSPASPTTGTPWIDSTGAPWVFNQYDGTAFEPFSDCRALRSSTQSINNATWTKIQYSSESYDAGGEFDPSTNYNFTATEAGTYAICAGCVFSSLSDGKFGQIRLVGSTFSQIEGNGSRNGGASGVVCVVSCVIRLAAGETVHAECFHDEGSAVNLSADGEGNYFMVKRLL